MAIAVEKKAGVPITIDDSHPKEVMVVLDAVRRVIERELPLVARRGYKGDATHEICLSSEDTIVRIVFTCERCGGRLRALRHVLEDPRRVGVPLSLDIVRLMKQHMHDCPNRDSSLLPGEYSDKVDEEAVDQYIASRKPPKVCPQCGETDPMYPKWEHACDHEN